MSLVFLPRRSKAPDLGAALDLGILSFDCQVRLETSLVELVDMGGGSVDPTWWR